MVSLWLENKLSQVNHDKSQSCVRLGVRIEESLNLDIENSGLTKVEQKSELDIYGLSRAIFYFAK